MIIRDFQTSLKFYILCCVTNCHLDSQLCEIDCRFLYNANIWPFYIYYNAVLTKPLRALWYIVNTTTVYLAWRWLTKSKHVADDKLLIKLFLGLFFLNFINSIFKYNVDALLKNCKCLLLYYFQKQNYGNSQTSQYECHIALTLKQ